ncbi:MAG TPA: enoyl-CoA hydratase/isomerase family protein [Solirubrobacterales bacterium]
MPGRLSLETTDGIAVVTMKRPPANALAPDLLEEGAELMDGLRADPPDAVVITGSQGFFSGGVDLKLAPTLTAEEQAGMVAGINRLFIDWYSFPRPVVAAVSGHAVAGGMILALCADRRIGSGAATYGLTELRVGVPYPAAAIGCVRAELSPAAARRLVLEAELIDGEAALGYGLVDELLPADAVLGRARQVAAGLAELPARAYETVKGQLRGPVIERMRAGAADDPMSAGWIAAETADAARAAIERES